ncbi:MAG TPA: DegT/DnrJ/EryC1/StrS family aminotransferase [Kofleriaceae bacterium]|jgi:dTDP-4-amino-4,6-dideoxygalactose transaminase|nr:DegT/DnrJ/EryC1/StrS family aminotransferase [Kofleriaceae bacterium]
MKVPFVDLPALIAPSKPEYLAAFARILDTGGFIGGPAVSEFEAGFARYCGAPHAASVRTGTDALVLALRALGVGPGDEVITAANSFFATAEAISHAGATPVLADVDDDTLLIDAADAARRVTPRTRCVIPVHLFGQLADLAAIGELAAAHQLRVLEDSAQAHGATRTGPDGERWRAGATAGSAAEIAAFSFYPTKNLGALGEGGAVTTRDPELAARVMQLRDHGQAGRHDHVAIGYNARLDALQCACLSISLAKLDAGNAARARLAAHYRALLAGVPGVRLIGEPAGSSPVYHLMVVRVDAARRDAIRDELAARGVATAIHYPRPIHLQRAYAHLGQGPGSCPVAERAAGEMISLPMYPDLTLAQVDHVAQALATALR